MLDHTGFVVTDLAKARRFDDAVAGALAEGPALNPSRPACGERLGSRKHERDA